MLSNAKLIAAVCILAIIGGSTAAIGLGPERDGEILACYDKRGANLGEIRLLVRGSDCDPGERLISFLSSINAIQTVQGPPGLPGPIGEAGTPGATGEQGIPGATNVVARFAESVGFSSISPTSATSPCDPGETVTGGGFETSGYNEVNTPRGVLLVGSAPSGNGWSVTIRPPTSDSDGTLRVYALCASP